MAYQSNACQPGPIAPDGTLLQNVRLPVADNEPRAVETLLTANKILRKRRWPEPYDRTRHQMIIGDARDLSIIANESVHLIVTSPPYFNLKPYASDGFSARK
jgi:modification methylase